ncbi:MAG: YdeI/OmpD-associated family protein [Syntrophothermus sp.]
MAPGGPGASEGSTTADHEAVTVTSAQEWRAWLEANHASSPGIWLTTYKKSSGGPHVPYESVAEEAVAFGWVDSRPRRLDAERSQLLLTPRRPRSRWSRANRRRAERLLAEGRMAPAGLAAVEAAKADGSWDALEEVEDLVEPDDLRAALDRDPAARRHWDAFPPSSKRIILEWISAAKRPQTRSRRVDETARSAAENIRANHWRQPKSGRGGPAAAHPPRAGSDA